MDWKTAAKLGISGILLVALAYLADWSEILKQLTRTNPGLYLLAVFLFMTTYISRSYRWVRMSNSAGYSLSFVESFKIISICYSFNKLFFGNAGDFLRSKIFQRYEEIRSHGSIIGITAMERYLDAFTVITIIAVSLYFLTPAYIQQVWWLGVPFITVVAVYTGLIFIDRQYIYRILDIVPLPIGKGLLKNALRSYQKISNQVVVESLLASYYGWIIEVFIFYTLAISLGLPLTFWEAAFVTSTMSLISALPISPSGIGPVEATGAGLLVLIGLDYQSALSLVILERSIEVVLMALVGLAVYWYEEAF